MTGEDCGPVTALPARPASEGPSRVTWHLLSRRTATGRRETSNRFGWDVAAPIGRSQPHGQGPVWGDQGGRRDGASDTLCPGGHQLSCHCGCPPSGHARVPSSKEGPVGPLTPSCPPTGRAPMGRVPAGRGAGTAEAPGGDWLGTLLSPRTLLLSPGATGETLFPPAELAGAEPQVWACLRGPWSCQCVGWPRVQGRPPRPQG